VLMVAAAALTPLALVMCTGHLAAWVPLHDRIIEALHSAAATVAITIAGTARRA
jgi:hypothetical protein